MAYTKKGGHIKAAAQAHTDLNIFAAVVALMENSLVSADCHITEQRIVKLCRAEMQRCLARYDQEMAKAGGGAYGRLASMREGG